MTTTVPTTPVLPQILPKIVQVTQARIRRVRRTLARTQAAQVTNYESAVALFDLDGTLADYDGALLRDLKLIQSPGEASPWEENTFADIPYLEARRHMITSQVGWWLKLDQFKLGWDILEEVKRLGFRVVVLTKGPSTKFSAWSEKVEWCNENLKHYIDGVTITHDKSLVYGKVLVDDYPDYVTAWLRNRPRGLVIMPAHSYNKDFKHEQVVRYDGTNMDQVVKRLVAVTRLTSPEAGNAER